MSETKWTPGPWAARDYGTWRAGDSVLGQQIWGCIRIAFTERHNCGEDQEQANARLIASAPDLYAMLDEANGAWMVMAEELSLTPEQVARHNALTRRIYKVLETARGEA